MWDLRYTFFFYKKLGSALSTKSFLISHENFGVLVVKVSWLVSYFFGPKIAVLFEVEPSSRERASILHWHCHQEEAMHIKAKIYQFCS